MGQGGLVGITYGDSSHTGENSAAIDVSNAIQVNPARSKPAPIQNSNKIPVAIGFFPSNNSHLKRSITITFQQGVSNAKRRQLGLK